MAGASNFTVSISITLHGDRSIDTDRGSGKEGERNTQRTPVCVCVCVNIYMCSVSVLRTIQKHAYK